jgi:protein subunit release factor B
MKFQRKTDMLTFAVSEEKNRWLREAMAALNIREEELEERFVRSSGKGGQHVNKTSTCVWLRHIPTGIEVKCMAERNQSVNRFLARRELVEKLAALAGVGTSMSRKEEKARKQKARRQRRAGHKYAKNGEDKQE